MQQVEHHVLHRHPLDELRGGCRDVHAVLQQAEVRAAVPVERDELAVDDHTLAQLESGDLRVGAGDVAVIAAIQPQPAKSGVADRANTVELDLERPPRTNRNRTRRRQHRPDSVHHPPTMIAAEPDRPSPQCGPRTRDSARQRQGDHPRRSPRSDSSRRHAVTPSTAGTKNVDG